MDLSFYTLCFYYDGTPNQVINLQRPIILFHTMFMYGTFNVRIHFEG